MLLKYFEELDNILEKLINEERLLSSDDKIYYKETFKEIHKLKEVLDKVEIW